MTHYYCSTFSKDYAYKGLLLYSSLLRWDKDFHFFMICLHDEARDLYEQMNLKNATIIPLSFVEWEDHRLRAVKKTRNDKEYIWTAKASIMLFILKHFHYVDHIVWLDGDTFFYSSPEPIFEEWGHRSIMLTEERWRKADRHKINRYGKYNTGFMGFKRDDHALHCLHWFRNNLIEWCYDRHEGNRWSDQGYVNDWPERFRNVGVIKNIGVNVTPYIMAGLKATKSGEHVYVNGKRLILFHHYGFRYYDGNEFELCDYALPLREDAVRWIYLPYIRACNGIMEQIRRVDRNFYRASKPKNRLIRNYFNLPANEKAGQEAHICTVLTKDYLIQGLALYYSLMRYSARFRLWILCVDDTAYSLLEKMNLANVTLISLHNIRTRKLAEIEQERQIHEFCWTLKGELLTYLLKNNFNLRAILYMDADLFFFTGIEEIYKEWGERSVFLTRLRHSPKRERIVGKYSAGLIGFKRDKTGRQCLRLWRKKCRDWCYDRLENGRWGDQKYLNDWPRLFSGIKISSHKGINAGPWQIRKGFEVHDQDGAIFWNGMKLVCFHFSGFEIINENEFKLCKWKKTADQAGPIYDVYIDEIQKIIARVKSLDKNFLGTLNKKRSYRRGSL